MPKTPSTGTDTTEWVAQRTLVATDQRTGHRHRQLIRLALPERLRPGSDGTCQLRLEGALKEDVVLRGADPMHALELALKYADSRLKLARHLSFAWPDGQAYRPGPEDASDFAPGP